MEKFQVTDFLVSIKDEPKPKSQPRYLGVLGFVVLGAEIAICTLIFGMDRVDSLRGWLQIAGDRVEDGRLTSALKWRLRRETATEYGRHIVSTRKIRY